MKLKVQSLKLKVKANTIYNNILFIIIVSFLLSAFSFQLSPVCEASFLDIGLGPRAMGMGNAFTGLADDGLAIFYNPAGLGQLMEKEVGFSYASLYPGLGYPSGNSGLGDMYASYSQPLPDKIGGVVGGMWINRSASDLYTENSFIISYGRLLKDGIFIGANFKVLALGYSQSKWIYDPSNVGNEWLEVPTGDPVFANGTSAAGISMDVGVLVDISEKLRVGFCIKDLNQPDIHLKDPNPVPMSIKIGAKYDLDEFRLMADLTTRNYDYNFNAGVEWWMVDFPIGLRGGMGFGSRNYAQMSAGASYLIMPMSGPFMYQIDYAFLHSLSGIEGTGGNHRFGMSLRIK